MFLSRLLTAFTGPTPLPVPVDDRFDLVSIANWLDAVSDTDRVVLFERLGDLALDCQQGTEHFGAQDPVDLDQALA